MTTNKQLRELVEKVGSGYWYEAGELLYHDSRSGEAHGLHHDEDGFIVAASPATVLSLLDENESLQAECEALQAECDRLKSELSGMATAAQQESQAADHYKAECEALRKDAGRLDFLDARNRPLKMGWSVSDAPAGNVSIMSMNVSIISIMSIGGREPTSIRSAIDAAMAKEAEK